MDALAGLGQDLGEHQVDLATAGTATQESTGQYIDDTVITAKVKAAIFDDSSLKSAEINRAVTVTRGIEGVQSVKNDMRVK